MKKKTARNDGFQVNILKFSVLNIIMYVINYFKESFNDAPDGQQNQTDQFKSDISTGQSTVWQ